MLAWLALLSPAFPTRAPTAPKWPNATKCRASIASNLCTHIVCDELGADRNCSDPLVCYRCAMLNFAAFTSTKKEPVAVECPCIGPNRAANRGCAATNQLNAAEAMANACGLPSPTEEASTVVSLPDGRKLKGFVPRGYPSAQHRTFRGIPYAAPPVGDLRWRPPQAYPAWHGVRDAKEFGATCAQLGPGWTSILGVKSSSEDCLFLNVYAPLPSSSIGGSAFGMYPTMLYMPAGQLTWGSSADLENLVAPQIPVAADVIFITANYRVGPAGFLAMEAMRSRSPTGSVGNYGTLDQRAVLQWIRDNIVAFGGDPSNVVLWGESAGASIVSDHIVLKRSQPLFSKAIIESGAFNPWAYKTLRTAEANARHLAQNLNCSGPNATSGVPHPSDAALVKCLLNASIEDLNFWSDDVMGAASAFPYTLPYSNRMDKCLWGPTIDGVELTDRPDLLLARGAASPKLAVLMGTNRDEGSTFTFAQHGFGDNATTNQSAYRDWVNHAKAPKPPVVVPWEKKTPGNCSVYLNASRNPHVRTCVLAHAHDGHPKYNPANITIGNTSACFHCIQNLSEVKMHCGDIRHKNNRTFRAMNKNASLIAQFVCRAAYPSPHYTPGGGSIEVTNATDFNAWAANIWGTNVARVATEMYKPNSTVQGITSWWCVSFLTVFLTHTHTHILTDSALPAVLPSF